MKIETMGKTLIAIGVIIGVYALTMPVALEYSDYVNIDLVSKRQNTLILGGLLFIAGIILFAVFKMKQTREEVEAAAKLLQDRMTQPLTSFMAAMKKCPFCAENIKKEAVVCRYCHRDLPLQQTTTSAEVAPFPQQPSSSYDQYKQITDSQLEVMRRLGILCIRDSSDKLMYRFQGRDFTCLEDAVVLANSKRKSSS